MINVATLSVIRRWVSFPLKRLALTCPLPLKTHLKDMKKGQAHLELGLFVSRCGTGKPLGTQPQGLQARMQPMNAYFLAPPALRSSSIRYSTTCKALAKLRARGPSV